jgi:hypothetical protein
MWCKGSRKEVKIQQFRYRDTANVELKCTVIPVIIGTTGMVTKSLREKSVSYTGKTFDRFTTADNWTGNSTHISESTAVWNWKCEWGGSLLIQQKYQEEKTCDRRQQQQQQQ